ncbi:MAG: hypothetical protein R3B84_13095 [Zavarzinella sp.]
MSNEKSEALEIVVPSGWECARLDELLDEERGISYGIVQPGNHEVGGVPIVRVNNIRGGRLLTDDAMRVSAKIEAEYRRTRLRGGELLLSLVGTLGEYAVVPPSLAGWNVARAVAVIPLRDGIDPNWVAMCLGSSELQSLMRGWATTTVQATLNLRDVRRLPILLAPEPNRSEITRVVKHLDDKIEQNRKTGKKLEELARAVFKAWFVDFEPVKAKAAGATSFPGMPAETFATLPTQFVDSPLGPIPEGWEVGTLGDAVTLSKQQVKPQAHADETFEHFSIPAYDASANPVSELGGTIMSNKFSVVPGCVLFSKLNPRIPRIWLPPLPGEVRQISSTEFLVLVPNTGWTRELVWCQLSQDAFRDILTQGASGTSNSHQRIRPQDFINAPVVIAAPSIRHAFSEIVIPLFLLREQQHQESRKLAELRDYLLPRLLSGKVRVKAALDKMDSHGVTQ